LLKFGKDVRKFKEEIGRTPYTFKVASGRTIIKPKPDCLCENENENENDSYYV
jgi:hypothetical protein